MEVHSKIALLVMTSSRFVEQMHPIDQDGGSEPPKGIPQGLSSGSEKGPKSAAARMTHGYHRRDLAAENGGLGGKH